MTPRPPSQGFELQTERLGPLPLINHILEQLQLDALLERFVPTDDARVTLPYAKCLGVLLRSVLVEREPIYRQQETVATYAPDAFGLADKEKGRLSDDRMGRTLQKLFDADRGGLLTEVVLAMGQRFAVSFKELHNDSTTIRFTGQYRKARGRSIRGRRGPWITYGHSKDHRPDLKQLLFILTVTGEEGIPVQFRCTSGNTNDNRTHIETWQALREVAGRADFLYVADAKLCTRENMDAIDGAGGRLVTVIPRNRLEDEEFREWIQTHQPEWEKVVDRPNRYRRHGPRDRWWVFRYPIPSREGWPVTWVWSSSLALRQEQTRREHVAAAIEELRDLQEQLSSSRGRWRDRQRLDERIERILGRGRVRRYLRVRPVRREEHSFRQERRGRPGPNTRYKRITRQRFEIEWEVDEEAMAYDRRSDGMYPLLTNDRELSAREVFEAHKCQPTVENRFRQIKSVHQIAPVFLKNEDRIEGLFYLYFLALLVSALIERELRRAMQREGLEEIPLYPEERACHRPTAEQVFRLFGQCERHTLTQGGKVVQVFSPQLTQLQRRVLALLQISPDAYR